MSAQIAEQFTAAMNDAMNRWRPFTQDQWRQHAYELVKESAYVDPLDDDKLFHVLCQATEEGSIEAAAALFTLASHVPAAMDPAMEAYTKLLKRLPPFVGAAAEDIFVARAKLTPAGVDEAGNTVYRLSPDSIAELEAREGRRLSHSRILAIERAASATRPKDGKP